MKHWDIEVRKLAAASLARFVSIDLKEVLGVVLPFLIESCLSLDLIERHGAALGLAEILKELGIFLMFLEIR